MNLKSLVKDTALYGLSSIVGRFLSYLLVPLHTLKIASESGGYGIVSNLYAHTALLLAILTFGMETTLFRFSNKQGEDAGKVYGTTLKMVGGVALLFLAGVLVFLGPISVALGYEAHPEYVGMMASVVAMDAFQAIMFSRLRQQGKALKFVILKFAYIIPDVLLNLVIFLVLPKLFATCPRLEALYIRENYGVGLIFAANLLCTTCVFFGFGRELGGLRTKFDLPLAKRMLGYTWPLLILSIMGMLNQSADKILFPRLVAGPEGNVQLGIYSAAAKLAMIMTILTQAFRYAYEPIVFNSSRDKDNPETLADGMKFYVLSAMFAWAAIIVYLPVLKYIIGPGYWEGLKVIPIVMMAEIFMGVYFNLSFWYKLTDRTWWGAVMSGAGAVVMIALNIWGVPRYGYMACAWGGFAGYGVSMVLSFILGRKYYPVRYDASAMALFTAMALATVGIYSLLGGICIPVRIAAGTVLLALYALMYLKELKKQH